MKNTSPNTANEMKEIFGLINKKKYKDALNRILDFEKKNPGDNILQYNKTGFLIDIGFGLKNQTILKRGIEIGEENLINPHYNKYQNNMYYNLANGYFSMYVISERANGIEAIPLSKNLQNAKNYYRKALFSSDIHDRHIKKQILVNYGNCLDTLKRGVEALYVYDNALQIDKNFSMAIGNRAKALMDFADISGQYRAPIYAEAYQAIQSIINKQDLFDIGGLHAKQAFQKVLEYIESLCKDRASLTQQLKHPKYETTNLSDFENFYINYCSREKLFLNFHVHHEHCEASIKDPIFIGLITKIDDNDTFYNLAKNINQIKEDYAIARLLLVQSQYKRHDFDNISQLTTYVYCLDYSQFNLYVGLLKSAFKEAYDILDKIAVFINDYYNLGFKEKNVHFRRVSNKKRRASIWDENDTIRDKILNSKNFSLYALYDIFQDFKAGEYKEIYDIRNTLTHRKLVIYDSMGIVHAQKDDLHSIVYEAMLEKTSEVLRLAKSAIIYLINFVNMEENKKRTGSEIVPIIPVDTSQFL